MKKMRFIVGLVLVFLTSTLFTACNVGEDSPQEFQQFAIYNDDYPASFELISGIKFETSPVSTLVDGDMALIYYSLDENRTFKLLGTQQYPTPFVMNNRLDTLGTAKFISIQMIPFKKYLWISPTLQLNADQTVKKAIYLSCDSARLGSVSNADGFVKNDTMFLQMHFKHAGTQGYSRSVSNHFYSFKNLNIRQDSITIAVRYKDENGADKSAYTGYKVR